jgi:hypothetical protein
MSRSNRYQSTPLLEPSAPYQVLTLDGRGRLALHQAGQYRLVYDLMPWFLEIAGACLYRPYHRPFIPIGGKICTWSSPYPMSSVSVVCFNTGSSDKDDKNNSSLLGRGLKAGIQL